MRLLPGAADLAITCCPPGMDDRAITIRFVRFLSMPHLFDPILLGWVTPLTGDALWIRLAAGGLQVVWA